ncbi:MAG: DUF58 domain-containing protein [Planctomycetia bacterium]|jgi:uncharacterized protein (DUF58 family)
MAQDISEILKKVRHIQLVANRKVDELLAGQYKSVFRGRGMEFDEVREYQPGDDIRTIDWNVTARSNAPFIKRFVEERELTVMFLVDVSASGIFGSRNRSKLETAIELAAILMFSALKNNDKVGLLTFCDDIVDYYPPRKGKANVLHLIRELVASEPKRRQTNMGAALEYLNRIQKRRSVVFLISDFLDADAQSFRPSNSTRKNPLQKALAVANRRHDVVGINVSDPREHELPDVGFISLLDPETGQVVEVDTHSPEVRRLFATATTKRAEQTSATLRRSGIDELAVHTDEEYDVTLRRFFRMREKRFR